MITKYDYKSQKNDAKKLLNLKKQYQQSHSKKMVYTFLSNTKQHHNK